jgi:hypothetical protein
MSRLNALITLQQSRTESVRPLSSWRPVRPFGRLADGGGLLDACAETKEPSSLEATSGPLKPKSWKRGGTRHPAAWPLKQSRSSTSSWRHATRLLQEAMKFIRKMEPHPSSFSTPARLMNIFETEDWKKSATSHEATLLQQQQEERRNWRRRARTRRGWRRRARTPRR